MAKVINTSKNIFSCPFCTKKYISKQSLYHRIEEKHEEQLNGLSPAQVYFNYKNKYLLTKGNGKCIIDGKPTPFNEITERYERLCSEECRQKYREMFKKRMLKKYGKEHLLDDPEQQKKMLANRKISGVYVWRNGYRTKYTGTYEKNFLEFMDYFLNWNNPEDIMMPAPQIFRYVDEDGVERFYIPDAYITSLNLIVEIKASTENNTHYYREREYKKEKIKDEILKKSDYDYIKIVDNNFKPLFDYILNKTQRERH